MTYEHYSPEWLAAHCDHGSAFERAVHRALTHLLDENKQLRAALEQPQVEQEPVAWMWEFKYDSGAAFSTKKPNIAISDGVEYVPLYTRPQPKREPPTDSVKDAFFEGFTSVETYNDTLLNSAEEAWAEYKAAHGIGCEK